MERRQAILAAAGLLGMPVSSRSAVAAPALPDPALAERDPDKYWARIRREQFVLPEARAFMNNGSLGVAPKPVLHAVADFLHRGAAMAMPDQEYPRWGYEDMDAHRGEMAAYLGCKRDQLAFTHNATEAMSVIANGIDLRSGDEVVMTNQEHGSGKNPWFLKRARVGITVREVPIPLPPSSQDDIADRLISAIGPSTRVLFFSAITTATGLIFPVRKICDAARAKGVITVVDGAHLNGQVAARIEDLGCDYYAGSPHKWMFAPAGCGILWGREEALEKLWPVIVTGGWDNPARKAARFMSVGTNNRAIFEGMLAGVRFANAIGPERIYARIHALAREARERAEKLPFVKLLTPADDRMYGSLVTFEMSGVDPERFSKLCAERKIWTLPGTARMRVSTHIHTRRSDIETLFRTIEDARKA
ncbi:MAG: aminotransferase class V-fold PLP-dependent enzyme [Acidobacteria bacterium]|nr:aminotransferase class V-fold PLP-dependent enzyme [Acidobacteriota bacterium]